MREQTGRRRLQLIDPSKSEEFRGNTWLEWGHKAGVPHGNTVTASYAVSYLGIRLVRQEVKDGPA